ncbi:serine/threonine-protein kinase [Nannocystis radixulma]|uniref:Serine/threonine-protein kinase n=1 Tax=Nannocystis radixulma TaxID=2995305 RepID=A0ABT5AYK2_9BACT|nr:serine/threonine-protein kinase [Nannocystis radixulma]MDC0666293.1 serine/threonine-protein kinase [Nannocystis radixulma]
MRTDPDASRDSGDFEAVGGSSEGGDFGRMYVDAARGAVAYEAATREVEAELEPFRAGRYVIMKHLGHGAMGNVFLAYDPDLDRKVAVKMLRESSRALVPASLVREAKAMARLTHPNVVGVFDVGVCDRGVYVAMELVEGVTLRTWLKEQPRGWREVLALFIQAGSGLAAAHEAGLVHHDFKPDNVLVGARGRAMVSDFGLARVHEAAGADMSGEISDAGTTRRGSGGVSNGSSTVASSRGPVGTLAYMAPERLKLQPSDARSDQFSFCVALYEGVYGRRPFVGEDAFALKRALLQDRPQEPPRGSVVPPRLWKVLRRGLARDPAARYPGMDALLAELSAIAAERPLRPWRWLAAAGSLAGVLGALSYGAGQADRCGAAGEALAVEWTPAVRAELQEKFAGTAGRWARVESTLDDYVTGWQVRREAVCTAAARADVAGSEELRARASCLEHPRMRFTALVELLVSSTRIDVDDAARAAAQLPALADCDDRELLALGLRPPDAHERPRVSSLRAALERARVREVSGEYAQSLAMAEAAVGAARGLDYPPVLAEALYQRGRVEHYLGRSEAAVASLSEAVDLAEASRHEVLVAEVWQYLVEVGALHWRPGLPVLEWVRRARASAERLGRPAADSRARGLQAEGLVARGREQPRAAESAFRKALSLWAQSPAPDAVAIAKLKLNLATALVDQEREADAAVLYTEAEQGFVAALGPRHPYVLVALYNLGLLEEQRGRLDAARAAFERALAVARYVFGDSHGKVLELHLALARVDLYEGLASSALAHGEAARAIFDTTGSADDEVFAVVGEAQFLLGGYAEALAAAERELTLAAALHGTDGEVVARAHAKAGEALLGLHLPDEAEARFVQAQTLLARIPDADSDAQGFVLKGLGQTRLIRGDHAGAAQLLRLASAVWANAGSDFREVADTQWCLAEALTALGETAAADERRAAAGRFYARFGEAGARRAAELAGWLRPPS